MPQRADTCRKKSVGIVSRRLECTHTEACEKCSKQEKGFFRYITSKKMEKWLDSSHVMVRTLFTSLFSQKGKSLSWPPSCQSGRRELQLRRDKEGARERLASLEELTSQARWMTSPRTEGKRRRQNWDLLGDWEPLEAGGEPMFPLLKTEEDPGNERPASLTSALGKSTTSL